MIRVGALVSGGGRTVLNLQDAIERGEVDATIVVVITHDESLPAVARCRERGIDVVLVASDHDAIDAVLKENDVQLVCLAGYLRWFRVGECWRNRTINIHPALLPKHGGKGMYGEHVHAAVLAAGKTESGCTVHLCNNDYDDGRILMQARVPVRPDDTASTLGDGDVMDPSTWDGAEFNACRSRAVGRRPRSKI